jgi:hypothetical protein
MHTLARRQRDPELTTIVARVQALEIQVAQVMALLTAGRQPVDPIRDARLTSAIAAVFGGEVFGVADLSASADPELRAVLAGVGPRALGAWLRRLRRDGAGPYQVHRVTRDGAGNVWALRVCDEQTSTG